MYNNSVLNKIPKLTDKTEAGGKSSSNPNDHIYYYPIVYGLNFKWNRKRKIIYMLRFMISKYFKV